MDDTKSDGFSYVLIMKSSCIYMFSPVDVFVVHDFIS